MTSPGRTRSLLIGFALIAVGVARLFLGPEARLLGGIPNDVLAAVFIGLGLLVTLGVWQHRGGV